MIGCLYEFNGEVRAHPNIDRLKKKIPEAKIIKEIEDIKTIDKELLKYKGIEVKEKQTFGETRDYQYQYRLNTNTVLCAHNKDSFKKLKMWYNIND